MQITALFVVCVLLVATVFADLPVHCLYEQAIGTWTLSATNNNKDSSVVQTCTLRGDIQVEQTKTVVLSEPNKATDDQGNVGTWTMIYDQGMEIIVGGQKFFAFFMYTQNGTQVVSDCSKTLTGWYHEDNHVPPMQWGCFQAAKSASAENSVHIHEITSASIKQASCPYAFAKKLNAKQSSWIAGVYDTIDMKQYAQLVKPETFRVDARKKHMAKMQIMNKMVSKENGFPDYFDWRNRTGVSFVNQVRNQGKCGSCYAFSTMAMLESRARIATDNQWQPVFAPQTIVSCDMHYSQGCDGGFPYLVAKYTQDFGIVEENCNPYNGSQIPCVDLCPAYQKTYVAQYEYVGGYYGASNADNMMYTIMQSGPITVGIEVYRDLFYYKGGVYHHVADMQDNTFEVLNHAVVITGWGVTADGDKYWIVRNSWGETWGVNGYFLIRRGVDECAIESLAVNASLYRK